MAPGTVPFRIDRHRYHLILDTLPAWVCTQCGEAYFEEAAVAAMQHMIQAIDTSTATLRLSAGKAR